VLGGRGISYRAITRLSSSSFLLFFSSPLSFLLPLPYLALAVSLARWKLYNKRARTDHRIIYSFSSSPFFFFLLYDMRPLFSPSTSVAGYGIYARCRVIKEVQVATSRCARPTFTHPFSSSSFLFFLFLSPRPLQQNRAEGAVRRAVRHLRPFFSPVPFRTEGPSIGLPFFPSRARRVTE